MVEVIKTPHNIETQKLKHKEQLMAYLESLPEDALETVLRILQAQQKRSSIES